MGKSESSASDPTSALPALDSGSQSVHADSAHGKDYRTFQAGGEVTYGQIGDSYTSDLVMYLAGNQFMVMDELIPEFQKKNPDIVTVYVETIPPGQILKDQILRQGEVAGQKTARNPDLYGSVSLQHLGTLKDQGLMTDYLIHAHNRLELMVARGNPKGIKGPQDLGRDDLIQCHPNPLNEGIFKFFGSEMLKDLGLYQKVTGGAQCKGCWAVEGKTWFTFRHHRETPQRIENGEADVGIVWASEVVHARISGRAVDGVPIPAPYNKQDQVAYAIGPLTNGRNPDNAMCFLSFLATPKAQAIYEKYGFVRSTAEELKLRPLA